MTRLVGVHARRKAPIESREPSDLLIGEREVEDVDTLRLQPPRLGGHGQGRRRGNQTRPLRQCQDHLESTSGCRTALDAGFGKFGRDADGAGREVGASNIGGVYRAHHPTVELDAAVDTLKFDDHPVEAAFDGSLEDAVIDLKGLHRTLGATGRFSFGSADLLMEVWGVVPGAVTPFGAINDTEGRVTVVLDSPMMEFETLNYHPLVNTMTTGIARDDLVRFLAATGHPPRIEPVAGAPEAG